MTKRFGQLAAALAALTCLTDANEHPGTVAIEIAGPPVTAEETGRSHLYLDPRAQYVRGGGRAQVFSMLGREDLAAKIDEEYSASPCPALAASASGEAEVLARIVAAARKHRVVIINESHTLTRHRDFSRKVIAALRPHGFLVLAAETFSNRNDGPDPVETHADLPYIHGWDGHYSNEPVFAAMLREAKQLGYRFAAYEQVYDPSRAPPAEDHDWRADIRDRETEQAANFAALIETLDPDEKLIVHVGYAHAREAVVIGDGWDHSWMAARLKRDHGIDPLTIAQTVCSGSADTVRLAATPPPLEGHFDLLIDHPPAEFRHGRAAWRFEGGYEAVAIPEAFASSAEPLVVEAFFAGEPFEAVPADRVWIEPGEAAKVKLALKPGSYTVRAVRPFRSQPAD